MLGRSGLLPVDEALDILQCTEKKGDKMISLQEHLKLRAIDILNERIERKIIPVGELLPDIQVTTFSGETFQIHDFLQEKPLLLCFMRASW